MEILERRGTIIKRSSVDGVAWGAGKEPVSRMTERRGRERLRNFTKRQRQGRGGSPDGQRLGARAEGLIKSQLWRSGARNRRVPGAC